MLGLRELVENPYKIKTTDTNTIVFDKKNIYCIDNYYYLEHIISRSCDSVSDFVFKYTHHKPKTIGIKIGSYIVYETEDINSIGLELPLLSIQYQNVVLFVKYSSVPDDKDNIIVGYNCHYYDDWIRNHMVKHNSTIKEKDKIIMEVEDNMAYKYPKSSNNKFKWNEKMIINLNENIYFETDNKICIKVDNLRRGNFISNYKFKYKTNPAFLRLYIGGIEVYRTDEIDKFDLTIPFINLQYHKVWFIFEFNKSDIMFDSQLEIDYTVDNYVSEEFNINEPVILELNNWNKDLLLYNGLGINCYKKGTDELKEQLNKLQKIEKVNKKENCLCNEDKGYFIEPIKN